MYKHVNGTAALIACLWSASVCAAPNATADTALGATPRAIVRESRMLEYAAHGGELESMLLREDEGTNGQRLTGMTRLEDGTRLWEEARFDRSGALIRAETMCSCASGASENVVFEAQSGVVEVRNGDGARRWSVPTDYPWVWVPRGCSNASHVTTPVSALVALRVADGGVRRLVDPKRFVSHTITSDQIIVAEDTGSSWVVLGDDAVLVRDGLPQRWRANALGVDVEQR